MSCEKFTNWAGDKGIHIPSSALTLAKIKEGEHLDFHVADDVIVTMKHQMTAMELIHIICPVRKMYFKGVNRASRMFTRNPPPIITAEVEAIAGTASDMAPTITSDPVAKPSRPNTVWNSPTKGRISVTIRPEPAESTR